MNDDLLLRYSRQIQLPAVDVGGQEKLLAARVLIVGMGGLGAPVTLYLTAAGVGQLTLTDFDTVDLSNLQRQIIHNTAAIGTPKVESAAHTAHALNPHVKIHTISRKLGYEELLDSVSSHDVVVDCSDNFPTRFNLNRACKTTGKPLISGAVIRMEGQITTFDFRQPDTACYRCLYDEAGDIEDTCSTTGILAPVAGIIGSIQATETLKVLLNLPTLNGYLLTLDALPMRWRKIKLNTDPNCPVCHLKVKQKPSC